MNKNNGLSLKDLQTQASENIEDVLSEDSTNEEIKEATEKMTPEKFKELYEENREFRRRFIVLKRWENKFYTTEAKARRKKKRKSQRKARRLNRK